MWVFKIGNDLLALADVESLLTLLRHDAETMAEDESTVIYSQSGPLLAGLPLTATDCAGLADALEQALFAAALEDALLGLVGGDQRTG